MCSISTHLYKHHCANWNNTKVKEREKFNSVRIGGKCLLKVNSIPAVCSRKRAFHRSKLQSLELFLKTSLDGQRGNFCSLQFRMLKYWHVHPCVPNLSGTELKRKRDKAPHLTPHFLFPVASNILPTYVKAIIKGTSLMWHWGEFRSLTNLLGTILYVASYNIIALIYLYIYGWGGLLLEICESFMLVFAGNYWKPNSRTSQQGKTVLSYYSRQADGVWLSYRLL